MLINWNALQPYKTKKDKSFEQLCYQVAYKLYLSEGLLTSIDDSGGGDGVEFYLTLPNNTQYGWQAKYYEGSPVRLTVSRKTKIKESLKKSILVHPEMVKWFLCLPMVLTVGENNWIQTELKNEIPASRNIELVIWDEDVIHELLNRPNFNGLKQAFFNELELSSTWFRSRFDHLSVIVEKKFDEDLYTENRDFFYWYVDPILINTDFRDKRIAYYPRKLQEFYEQGTKALKKLQYTNDLLRPLFNHALVEFEKLNKIYTSLKPALDERLNQLTANRIFETKESDYEAEIETIRVGLSELSDYRREWYQQNINEKGEKEQKDFKEQVQKFYPVESAYSELLEELKYYVSHSTIPLKWQVSHYLGNAGDGKTNFCIALARIHLEKELPVIFIPAIKFTSDQPISTQIINLLDIHSKYSFSDFLDTMDELGKIHNLRVPIILDGLNEAIDQRGHLNNRLRLDLDGIEKEIMAYPNLVLLTTCRPAYKETIWGKVHHDDKRFHSMYGFTSIDDKKRLIRRYFEVYKIQADLSFLSLEKFTKPLYLKIFCEAVNPKRERIVSVTLGYDSIYTIFDQFLERCNENIYQRLMGYGKIAPQAKYQKLASEVLQKLGKHLWEHPARGLDMETMMVIADGAVPADYQYSVTKALLDEELLLIRNWHDGQEKIYLTYDMLGGYFIAQHLICEGVLDIKEFFSKRSDLRIFGNDQEQHHPLYEDILAALLSLLPIRTGKFVHDLLGKPPYQSKEKKHLFGRSVITMIMLSPVFIPKEQIDLIIKLSDRIENLKQLLSSSEDVRFVSDHPFNFAFWSPILIALPMNIRDAHWSEYLRGLNEDQLEDIVTEFKSIHELESHTEEQLKKMDLVATFLIWTLTSTVHKLKEQATNGLFEFAVRYPELFFDKYKYAASINDPTVFEWMSSVMYNALTTLTKTTSVIGNELIKDVYNFITDSVLKPEGIHATNHLITRNYNYSIIRLLERRCSSALLRNDSEAIKSNFINLGVTIWQEELDKNEGDYMDGNSLVDYYFNKNKMPQIMVGKGNEYNRTPEYKATQAKLRWRAYQIGYDFQLFGEVDKQIARFSRFGEEHQQTNRYADKYIEIAHLEYCGYLDSLGQFKSHEDVGYLRAFKLKHDPDLLLEEPDPAERTRYVTKNFIDSKISLKKWCADATVPDVAEYLTSSGLGIRTGDFILLNGEISEIDQNNERQFFILMDVIFVKNRDLDKARTALFHPTAIGRGPEHKPTIRHVHKNEIPDADTIPQNDFTTWSYSLEEEMVDITYSTIAMYKNGKKLTEKQADKMWDLVLKGCDYMTTPRTMQSGIPRPIIRFTSKGDALNDYLTAFANLGIILKTEEYTIKESRGIDLDLDIFIPVVDIESEYFVCKNIIDAAGLRTKVGSTDLYDTQGKLAAFTHTARVKYRDGESFTYLDKTILKNYLNQHDLSMFWMIWGERDYYPEDGDWDKKPKSMPERSWTKFYKAIEFK